MIDALFGNMETVTKFFVAFVIVLALMALSFWLFRRLSGHRLGSGSTRGRQPRLAVIDAAVVDGRRRLVLVRRDNVEHLLMIGGPSDVVIEQNIVRAVPVASARELPPATRGNAEAPSRDGAAPRPDVGPAWPLQPEPPQMRGMEAELMARPRPPRAVEPEPMPRTPRLAEPEPMPRSQRLVDPEPIPRPQRLVDPEPIPRPQRLVDPEPMPAIQRAEPTMPRMAVAGEPPPRPATAPERPPLRAAPPMPGPGKPMTEPLRTVEPRAAPATADVNLADMAQRLEAALRRPAPPADARSADQPARPIEPPAMREAARPEPARPAAPERPRPPEGEAKPDPKPDARPASPKSVLDSLEQEMASLLGRPTGKE